MASETMRDRILTATIHVVGRDGYRETTVADVIERAGVSRTTFYKHFDDKHDCFLAAYDLLVERVVAVVAAECAGEESWLDRVRTGLAAIVELFAADPELARTALVEVAAAGPEARRRHWRALARFGAGLERGRDADGGGDLPEHLPLMAVGAVSGLIFDELLAGRARQLPALLPELLFALLVPFVGPTAAAEEMRLAAAPLARAAA